MDPPRGRNKRIVPTNRGWKQNQRSDYLLQGKAPPLMLCLFPFLENYEERKYHHKTNHITQKGGHHQQKNPKFGNRWHQIRTD